MQVQGHVLDADPPPQSRNNERGESPRLRWRTTMSGAVARLVEDLRTRGGLKGSDLANITHVSQATVSRWAAGKAAPQPKTQLVISDLRYVVDRLAEFYSPNETRIWLYARHPLLDGGRAIDLIHEGSADRVLAVIDSLSDATFT
jgi:transcriptional regulator with XRE-family HTH domain